MQSHDPLDISLFCAQLRFCIINIQNVVLLTMFVEKVIIFTSGFFGEYKRTASSPKPLNNSICKSMNNCGINY